MNDPGSQRGPDSEGSPDTELSPDAVVPTVDAQPDTGAGRMGLVLYGFMLLVLFGVLVVVFGALLGGDDSDTEQALVREDRPPEEVLIAIPEGTGAELRAGAELELFNQDLRVQVGDTLVIRNEDTENHTLGPYMVGPTETMRQTFQAAGIIEGLCTFHPSGRFSVTIV